MRVPIVVLALIATPFVSSVSGAQGQSNWNERREVESRSGRKSDDDKQRGDKDKKDKCEKRGHDDDRDRRGHDQRGQHDGNRCDSTMSTPTPPPPTGAEVRGSLYVDLNFNGARDAGEPGLDGWTVELIGTAGTKTTTTATDGSYVFSALGVDSYMVCVTPLSGYTQVMPNRGPYCAISRGFTADVTAELPTVKILGLDFSFTTATGG